MSNSIPLFLSPSVLSNYSELVRRLAKPLGSLACDLHHAATGMATESGEALSTTKKMWVYSQSLHQNNSEGQSHFQNLVEETGDLLFYVEMMCQLLQINMLDLMQANANKLNRRYPSGYSDEAAAERLDKAAAQAELFKATNEN